MVKYPEVPEDEVEWSTRLNYVMNQLAELDMIYEKNIDNHVKKIEKNPAHILKMMDILIEHLQKCYKNINDLNKQIESYRDALVETQDKLNEGES